MDDVVKCLLVKDAYAHLFLLAFVRENQIIGHVFIMHCIPEGHAMEPIVGIAVFM
jgi:hypothetical protein